LNSALRDKLLQLLSDGSTGQLSARSPYGDVTLFLFGGEVLAARCHDDDAMILRRLVCTGVLDRDEVRALRGQINGDRIEHALFSMLEVDAADQLCFDRLEENLARFLLSADDEPYYEPMDALFIGHLVMGHDTRSLVAQLEVFLHSTADLRDPSAMAMELSQGATPSAGDRPLWDLLSQPRSLASLLQKSPFEEQRTMLRLANMLLLGQVQDGGQTQDNSEQELMDELERAAADQEAGVDHAPETSPSAGVGRPDAEVFEEELAMFADHDTIRGAGQSGHFSKTQAELSDDRIDLTGMRALDEAIDEPIAALEAPEGTKGMRMNFGGPKLANDDAMRKIDVANQVLRSLSRGFDSQDGPGAGPAQVQLLLDGAPTEFSILFVNAQTDSQGAAPAKLIIANLRRRPPTEHRRLLNRGLADLIERAMNLGAETLDDETVDTFLEECVGYRSRLGL
jgi:hypothetical protein